MTLGDRIAVLDGGRVQQVGTPPHDLYHRPVNAFVAGFIGSPSMNLAVGAGAGRCSPDHGMRRATLAGAGHACRGSRRARGVPLLLGLRPDAFTWPAPHGAPALDVTVTAVEFLDNATLVLFEPRGRAWHPADDSEPSAGHWTSRLDGDVPTQVGGRLPLGVDIDSAYLFEPEGGLARPREEAMAAVPA